MRFLHILICIVFYGCNARSIEELSDGNFRDLSLSLNKIIINHYEEDSLNRNRAYVLPIMYFDFEAINYGSDSLGIKLDDHNNYKDPINAFVLFSLANVKDTLVLSNFENENKISFQLNLQVLLLKGSSLI